MLKTACIIIADGVEEIELGIIVNILNKAGINVTVTSPQQKQMVKGSKSVQILTDNTLEQVKDTPFDVIILPGGYRCSKTLADSETVKEMLLNQNSQDKLIAVTNTSPIVLASHEICLGKAITSYPNLKGALQQAGFRYDNVSNVVHDGNLVSSRAPATAFEFALKIVCHLCEEEENIALKITEELLLRKNLCQCNRYLDK